MDRLEVMLELENRNALPPDKQEILTELRNRGAVPKIQANVATGEQSTDISGMTPEQLNAIPNYAKYIGGITGMGDEGRVTTPPARWKQNIAMTAQENLPWVSSIGAEVLASPAIVASGPWAPATAAAAGGAGWQFGKTGARAITELLGFKPRGRASTAPEVVQDTLKDIPESTLVGLLNQFGGLLPTSKLTGVLQPKVGVETKEAMQRLANAKATGGSLTAAEATQSPGLQKIEGMLSQSLFGSGQLRDFVIKEQLKPLTVAREKLIKSGAPQLEVDALNEQIRSQTKTLMEKLKMAQTTELNQLRSGVQGKLGTELSQEQVGKIGKGKIEGRSQTARDYISKLYKDVNGPTVPLSKTTEMADAIIAQEKANPSADMGLIADVLPYSSEGKFGQGVKLPEYLDKYFSANPQAKANFEMRQQALGSGGLKWEDAHFAQSRLGELSRSQNAASATPGMKGYLTPQGRAYTMIQKGLREDMETAAQSAGGDVYGKYLKAQTATKKFKGIFDQDTLKLAQTDPQQFVRAAIQPNSGELITKAKSAMGNITFDGKVKPAFTNELLGVGKHDVFSPQYLKSQLQQYGDETLLKVYTKDELASIKELATNGKLALASKPLGHAFLRSVAESPYNGIIVDSVIGSEGSRLSSKTLSRNLSLMKAVVKPETFNGIKGQLAERIFPIDPVTTYVNPNKFATNVERLGTSLSIAFDKETAEALKVTAKFARAAQGAAKFNPSGTGQSVVSWSQYGLVAAAAQSATQGDVGGAAWKTAMALSPSGLAKLYLSKTGQKLLIHGFGIPANTKAGAALATRIIGIAGYNNMQPVDLGPQGETP